MALKLITPPAATPVTLAEAKSHWRVDHGDDDVLIARLLTAATAYIDGWSGILARALAPQTWDLTFDAFPADGSGIEIPLGPLISVGSVNYVDPTTEIETALDPSQYEVDTNTVPGWVVPPADSGWPSTLTTINAVRIRFVAGEATVPEQLRQAILMLGGHWYENREAVGGSSVSVPLGFDALVAPYKLRWF